MGLGVNLLIPPFIVLYFIGEENGRNKKENNS
jgi:hypothetical protein